MTRVSVVVPSHGRPLRLRWLLDALADQTLPATDWELIVVHDYAPATVARFLPAGARHEAVGPGTGPAVKRNRGWRAARAPLIAFTDDDCRPDPRWLEALLGSARGRDGAFVQGTVAPDPFEQDVFAAPHVRTLRATPPSFHAQTANMLYPRALLEALGGFDETLETGEDVDLAARARAAGAQHRAAPAAVVHHAVEALTLGRAIRDARRWRHLARVVRRHRALRRELVLGVFWDRDHALTALAMAGLGLGRPRLALPWLARHAARRGYSPAGLAVGALEAPGWAAADAARVLLFAAGGVRHRSLLL